MNSHLSIYLMHHEIDNLPMENHIIFVRKIAGNCEDNLHHIKLTMNLSNDIAFC